MQVAGWNPDVATTDAMTVPVLIAWASPSLVDVTEGDGEFIYAHLFEMVVGASGYHSQNTLHGMVGCPCDVLTPVDGSHEMIDFRIIPNADPDLYSMGDTAPDDLVPFQDEIMASYEQQAGAVCEAAEG
jgi:hypothetical protein